MSEGIYAALSGALVQERSMEILANNLANVASSGFKQDKTSFSEALVRVDQIDDQTLAQVQLGTVIPDFSQGPSRKTGRNLDLAIQGEGFFQIQTPEGTRYTRGGNFQLSSENVVVNGQGYPVLGQSGEIQWPLQGSTVITDDGTVSNQGQVVNQFALTHFEDTSMLVREGHGLWRAPEGVAESEQTSLILSGHIEQSNVNAVSAMTELVMVSRAHEAFHKSIEMFREIDHKAATELS